jgi:hypothetical protein
MSLRIDDDESSCNWNITYLHTPPNIGILSVESDIKADRVLYIDDGDETTGDLLSPANSNSFVSRIRKRVDCGVDLVVADGGFEFSGERYFLPLNMKMQKNITQRSNQ